MPDVLYFLPHGSIICSYCPAVGEGFLWQEANALQFPELLATSTCTLSEGHLQKGIFLLSHYFLSELESLCFKQNT